MLLLLMLIAVLFRDFRWDKGNLDVGLYYANLIKKTEHFTLRIKDYDTTKTANIKMVVLQS